MNEELIIGEAMKMFKNDGNPEKWNAFVELTDKYYAKIQSSWWTKLFETIANNREVSRVPGWKVLKWDDWGIRWFLEECEDAIGIELTKSSLRVGYNYKHLDYSKVEQLIKDPRFDIIKSRFDSIDSTGNGSIAVEKNNFKFIGILFYPDAHLFYKTGKIFTVDVRKKSMELLRMVLLNLGIRQVIAFFKKRKLHLHFSRWAYTRIGTGKVFVQKIRH